MAYLEAVAGGYKVRWREGGRGSPLLASLVIANEAEAEDERADIEGRVNARRAISRSRALGPAMPLIDIAHRWSAAKLADRKIKPIYANRTVKLFRQLSKDLGWKTVADITPAEVDRWRLLNNGKNGRLGATIRAVLHWAADRGQPVPEGTWVALRPARAPRRARKPLPAAKDIKRWSKRADSISPDAGALVHCLATYGWRPITAAKLQVRDLNLRRGEITLRDLKGGGDDLVHPLLADTVARLRKLCAKREPTDPLFLDPRTGAAWMGEDDETHGMSEWWANHMDDHRGIYDLKRQAISTMLARGLAPQEVALFTGHKSLSQVLTYARTNEERARAALAVIGGAGPAKSTAKKGARRVHGVASDGMRRAGGAA